MPAARSYNGFTVLDRDDGTAVWLTPAETAAILAATSPGRSATSAAAAHLDAHRGMSTGRADNANQENGR